MNSDSDSSVLFEAENDEDTYYAEIRRQILLLTSEDNEDLIENRSNNTISVTNNIIGGSSNRTSYNFKCASPAANNPCSWETQLLFTTPLWLVNLWKHGKGTGVFIPQVACRKNQRGRMNNGRRKIYRPVMKKD